MNQDLPSEDQRQAIRVEVSFQIHYRMILPDQLIDLKDEIVNHRTVDKLGLPPVSIADLPSDLEELEDLEEIRVIHPWIFKMWTSLERRLDYIAQLLTRSKDSETDLAQGICKSLSATGLSFHAREAIEPGERIYLRVQPPSFPLILVDMVGLVQRCDPVPDQENRWGISVNYDAFNSEDREELISYIFKRQREMLRRKSSY